jgi:hypothetical protein
MFDKTQSEREFSQTEESKNQSPKSDLNFQQCKLLILERSIDWLTPLFSPLTYESLIDELIGIKTGTPTLSFSKDLHLISSFPPSIFFEMRYKSQMKVRLIEYFPISGFIDIDSQLVDSQTLTNSSNNSTNNTNNANNNDNKSTNFSERKLIKRALNSNDTVFEQIRNKHIRAVGPALHHIAKQLESEINVYHLSHSLN